MHIAPYRIEKKIHKSAMRFPFLSYLTGVSPEVCRPKSGVLIPFKSLQTNGLNLRIGSRNTSPFSFLSLTYLACAMHAVVRDWDLLACWYQRRQLAQVRRAR